MNLPSRRRHSATLSSTISRSEIISASKRHFREHGSVFFQSLSALPAVTKQHIAATPITPPVMQPSTNPSILYPSPAHDTGSVCAGFGALCKKESSRRDCSLLCFIVRIRHSACFCLRSGSSNPSGQSNKHRSCSLPDSASYCCCHCRYMPDQSRGNHRL